MHCCDVSGAEDILVTALEEEREGGVGRVYLYSGRSLVNTREPKILQELHESGSKLFGFSIGDARTDLDQNGFYDLVIGDPGSQAQKAYVYYAKTFIRLVRYDGMIHRKLFKNHEVDSECPDKDAKKKAGVNFCNSIEIVVENKGMIKPNIFQRDEAPEWQPWDFKRDFTLKVRLIKDPKDLSDFMIHDDPQTVTIKAGGLNEAQKLKFWVYGDLADFYGDNVRLIAETTTSDAYELAQKFEGDILLSSETVRDAELSVGPEADVTMRVTKEKATVELGDVSPVQLQVELKAKGAKTAKLINGDLIINIGTAPVKLTTAATVPENLATCEMKGKQWVSMLFSTSSKQLKLRYSASAV